AVPLIPSPKKRSNHEAIVNISKGCRNQYGPQLASLDEPFLIENVAPPDIREAALAFWASIIGSATLGSSRWTQRRGRQLHRFQNRCKHRARLLTEKPLRSRRAVRTCEEKVVHGGEALP